MVREMLGYSEAMTRLEMTWRDGLAEDRLTVRCWCGLAAAAAADGGWPKASETAGRPCPVF